MRRIGYALFALAGLSVVIALVSIGLSGAGSTSAQNNPLVVYGIVNLGFALVNVVLGLVLVVASRAH
jgi:hypothetical protein